MISIIIPTRNEEKILEKTLKNVAQYSGEHEIIITDGQSSDKTLEIAKKYTDKIVSHSGPHRQTIAQGKNAGAAIAKGKFFVFLDADMTIPDPDKFFSKAKEIFSDKDIVALTLALRVLPEHETWADRLIFTCFNNYNYLMNNHLGIGAAYGEFQMVRADIFKRTNGYNQALVASEDYEFFRRLAKIGRTHCAKDLMLYHTGRRAHKVGWPKLLLSWISNGIAVQYRGRAVSEEWQEIR